jgi:adenine phosphoribosyltransferase
VHDGLKAFIRDVPDFPTKGILFRDITPLLRDAAALRQTVDALATSFRRHGVDVVAGVESRGFLFGAPLALALGVGFIPIRKRGKLPSATIHRSYALEYGANELEIHSDAVRPGERVLLVDDVLATGGTAAASAELVEALGADVVGLAFVLELAELAGRERLPGRDVVTLLTY